jgi:hypothetical protein
LRETKIAVGNPFERLLAQHYRTVLLSVSDMPPVANQPLILVCAEVALVPAAKALRLAQFYDPGGEIAGTDAASPLIRFCFDRMTF